MSSITGSGEGHSTWGDTSINSPRSVPTILSELAQRFHTLRLRYARWLLFIALANLMTTVGGLWLLLTACDYWLELPTWLRTTCVIMVSTAGLAALAWSIWWINARATARQFATRMEDRFDSMGQRLRTVLDLAGGKLRAPEAMLTALGHQTMARWETAQPVQILPRRGLTLSLVGLAVCLLLLVSASVSGPQMRTALLRSAGWDTPYTTMHVTPGNMRLLEGLQPEVQLELHGRPDRQVVLRYRQAKDTEWIASELTASPQKPKPDSLVFVSKLDKLSGNLQYQFETEVGNSPVYTIEMQPKIVLVDNSVTVQPPAYTQLPERTFTTEEVTVLVGSKVTVSIQASRPLTTVQLLVGPNPKQLVESKAQPLGDGSTWKFELPSDRPIQWQFSGSGEDDAPLPTVTGKLRIRQDESPRVDWQSPADEFSVNMLAEVPMSVMVSDDYGLTHAGIVFQLGDEEFVLKEWTLAAASDEPNEHKSAVTTRVRLDEVLPLESFELSERDFVSYYAFAEDNRQDDFQHVESEVRYLDIRPLKQLFSEIDLPAAGGGGRSFPALNELISRERYLYNRTRGVSRHYDATSGDQLRTLERMVETQSELANFTRYMIDFLASQGNDDTEVLAQAESAMLQASDALATADFETAILREQDAIRLLVEAKNSAEITLSKNNNPGMRAQLKNFQRQMINRLRRKMKPADTKVADDIKQIAEEQQRVADRVANWLRQPPVATPITKTESSPGDEPKESQEEGKSTLEDQLKASQQELLDRLTTVNSELSESVKQSSLATERLAAGLLQMDALTGNSAKGEWESFPSTASALASELLELGEQAKALAQSVPSSRIASLRDLTASLASRENEIANQLVRLTQSGQDISMPTAVDEERKAKAKAIIRRTQTIEDVLKLPMDSGDLRTSDIIDQLDKLVVEQKFKELLHASAQSAQQQIDLKAEENASTSSNMALAAVSTNMRDRAREHAYIAELFDQLQKQLLAPRLEQLRRLTNRASQLASSLSSNMNGRGQGGQNGEQAALPSAFPNGGGANKSNEEDQKAIRNLQMQLQSELQNAGLVDLAELLEHAPNNQGNQAAAESSGAAGSDRSGTGRAVAGASSSYNYDRLVRDYHNALLVRKKLQSLLQEMILIETTADRNVPVPVEYKELVDEYYKSLAE